MYTQEGIIPKAHLSICRIIPNGFKSEASLIQNWSEGREFHSKFHTR